MRTEEEIKAICEFAGDAIWIKNLQSAGDHDYVDAMFEHSERYSLTTISTAVYVIRDTKGECRSELLTAEFMDRVETVTTGLHAAITERACDNWSPEQFRPLAVHFTMNPGEWDFALQMIRLRGITDFDQLIGLLPQMNENASAPAMINGTL